MTRYAYITPLEAIVCQVGITHLGRGIEAVSSSIHSACVCQYSNWGVFEDSLRQGRFRKGLKKEAACCRYVAIGLRMTRPVWRTLPRRKLVPEDFNITNGNGICNTADDH